MEDIKYIVGKYYPNRGEYYNKCVLCGTEFFGRENKIHCSNRCRYHKNNKKAKNKKVGTREEFNQIVLFDEVLKTYYPASKGKIPISDEVLKTALLDLTLFTRLTKDPMTGIINYHYLDYCFSHDEKNKTIIIYIKDETD